VKKSLLPRPPKPALRASAPEVIRYPLIDDYDNDYDGASTNHLHWVITGFQRYEDGTFQDSVSISVEAPDEESALKRAMQIVKRNEYRVTSVTEACSHDLKEG
jgi:hypothetical protein